jgi:D-tyrosyl-tRNA(Tyr) deacylase
MRLLIQRVTEAKVVVDTDVTGAIGPGLLVFLGIHQKDTQADIPWLIRKLVGLRIFSDSEGKMNRSVQETEGSILLVSQFTLYGNCRNGQRPSFTESASGPQARALYDHFVRALKQAHDKVETGRFAASMSVSLVNDGPVTLMLDGKGSY